MHKIEALINHTTSGVAVAGVASAFVPLFSDVQRLSEVAGLWMPVLGATWLIVQIVRALGPGVMAAVRHLRSIRFRR